jgi:hypothetical protein
MGNDRTPPVHRTTVAEAARLLGISAEAVRGRIRRGTLPVEREEGTVYVLLDVPAEDRTDDDRPGDQTRTTGDQPGDRTQSEPSALISELRDRVESLEHQLEQERQANSEHRRLLAAALERIPPAIEPPAETPSDERDARETDEEQQGRGAAPPDRERGAERPWWRRVFGG